MQQECNECRRVLNLPDSRLPVGKPFSFTCPYCKHKNSGYIAPPDEPAASSAAGQPFSDLDQGGYPSAPEQPVSWEPPAQDNEPVPPASGDDWTTQRMAIDSQALESAQQWSDQSPVAGQPFPGAPPDSGDRSGRYTSPDMPPPYGDFTPDITRPRSEVIDEATMYAIMSGAMDERPRALVVCDDDEMADMLVKKLEAIGHQADVAVNLRDAAKQLKFADFSVVLIQEDYYGSTLSSNHLIKAVQSLDNSSRRGMLVAVISPTMVTLDDLLAFSLSIDAVINRAELETTDRILMSIIARHKKFYASYYDILQELGMA